MKQIRFVAAAAASALALGLSLASCSNGTEGLKETKFNNVDGNGNVRSITFFTDGDVNDKGEYVIHYKGKNWSYSMNTVFDIDLESGTFSGDLTKDGTVSLTKKKEAKIDNDKIAAKKKGNALAGNFGDVNVNDVPDAYTYAACTETTATATIAKTTLSYGVNYEK